MILDIDLNAIEDSFKRIADELMNHHVIKVKDVYYRIVDCEFYFNHKESHDDTYTHSHKEQSKKGSWYFHGSGVDITIGSKNSKGGILIRGIAKLTNQANANGDFIVVDKSSIGPLNVLTTLFSHFESVFDKDNCFYLVEKNALDEYTLAITKIFQCLRKGLNIDKDNQGFHNKAYRFISFPYLPHSEKGMIEAYLVDSKILDKEEAKKLFTLKYD
ncbi:MAG: hypothetical protein QM541_16175 [Flavobacterium sp.]|nr:hypothetical protein [Flavobacterium sp.]